MKEQQFHFETLYHDNYSKALRVCMGYVEGDEALAKDLAQEVFIKVWENLQTFRKESSISTWIYRIAVNTCLLQLRGRKFNKKSENLENISKVEDEQSGIRENQLMKMYQCIHQLSKENKSIILLELEGLPQKEIADIMGVSHEAIRVRVHRIKNSLTKCVQK